MLLCHNEILLQYDTSIISCIVYLEFSHFDLHYLYTSTIYFFDLDEARMIYQNDCRMTEELTLKSHQMREILTNKNFEKYYAEVFELLKDVRNEHTGREGLKYFFDYYVQRLNYLEVSKRMKLIEDDQWHINIVVCKKEF